jgi:hypothetical protein
VEAVEEFVVVAVRIAAGHIEKRLRERQRGAQLVGRVGCESLLFGDVCLEPREEAVDRVGEILELVAGPREREALVQVALRDVPCGRRHRAQRAQDPARDQPPERDRDHGHDRQRDPGPDKQLVKIGGVKADGPGVLLFTDMAHIAADVRVRQGFREGGWAGRPVPTSPRDDQVGAAGSADEEVGDREQHRPRHEKQAAVEQGQAQADGSRGHVEHPTWGEPGQREPLHRQIWLPARGTVSPSPAVSAAIASRRRPSRIASAIRGSPSSNTCTLRC